MNSKDSKKCIWDILVTTSKLYTKNTGLANVFRVKVGCCNLVLPYTDSFVFPRVHTTMISGYIPWNMAYLGL